MKLDYFAAHGESQLCVEVGQRFVHHEYRDVLYYRSAQRDALHLSAGKLFGELVEVRAKVENFRGFVYLFANFVGREHAAFNLYFAVVAENLEFIVVPDSELVEAFFTLRDNAVKRRQPFGENRSFVVVACRGLLRFRALGFFALRLRLVKIDKELSRLGRNRERCGKPFGALGLFEL